MEECDDKGKVWLRGRVKPVLAVRLGDRILVPGYEDEEKITCKARDGILSVDVNDTSSQTRIFREFPAGVEGSAPGTLFSGFTNTKHADILAVLPDSPGVRERRFEGPDYETVVGMDGTEFRVHASKQ